MDNVGHEHSTGASIEREAVVGVLMCLADVDTLPVRPWPLVAACQTLANELPAGSRHLPAIRPTLSNLDGVRATEAWLRDLAAKGRVHLEGRSITARWVAEQDWLAGWRLLSSLADAEESGAWVNSGQVLARTLDRWRNAASAA